MIDFPASPTLGQQFTAAGVTWTWDGAKWLPSGLPTVVPGINDNRIINGDMRIDQRNNGASGTATGYTIDRWQFIGSLTTKGAWNRNSNASGFPFPYSLQFLSNSAYSVLAGDYFSFRQPIEADMISDFQWGTANAQPVTLSFWAYSSLTGSFGGTIQNDTNNRTYSFLYSVPAANTWTKIAVTIPGDTAGTWTMKGNGTGVNITFGFGCGSTFSTPANAWVNGNFISATGAVSIVGTNGAGFFMTGVKLEIGSVATPYLRQSLAKSMADCQRYYQAFSYVIASGYASPASNVYDTVTLSATMRAAPTVAFPAPGYSNASAMGILNNTATAVVVQATLSAVGMGFAAGPMTCSAEL